MAEMCWKPFRQHMRSNELGVIAVVTHMDRYLFASFKRDTVRTNVARICGCDEQAVVFLDPRCSGPGDVTEQQVAELAKIIRKARCYAENYELKITDAGK